jgi:hypothetical protein
MSPPSYTQNKEKRGSEIYDELDSRTCATWGTNAAAAFFCSNFSQPDTRSRSDSSPKHPLAPLKPEHRNTPKKQKKERKNKKSYGQEAGNEVYSASKADREGLEGRPLSLSRSVRKNKGRVVALSTREREREGYRKSRKMKFPNGEL